MMPVAVPWYESEEDFITILEMLPVNESGGAMSHAEFIASIKRHEAKLAQGGFLPRRVTIKPAAIKAWCQACGKSVQRSTLNEYAMLQLGSQVLDKGKN
jgi:hypothetical protein